MFSIASAVCGIFAFKTLLIYCYFSTDFEVHRNWLAITHSLPVSGWYTEATSQWTLDYPPLFAWFELLLSYPASLVDVGIVRVSAEPYMNTRVRIFQRLTVLCADGLLVVAVLRVAKSFQKYNRVKRWKVLLPTLLFLIFGNGGLILVDNIHFQYNGFLSAFLLFSILDVMEEKFIRGAFWYAVVVCMKHIHLYLAPAYIAYYARNYCFTDRGLKLNIIRLIRSISIKNCTKLVGVLASVFLVSFGPFLYLGQMEQVLSRLFPFKRGLTHAYWAPNFWSLYNAADLGLHHVLKKLGKVGQLSEVGVNGRGGYTSGLVQEYDHLFLPSVSPLGTVIITIAFLSGFCLVILLLPRRGESFLRLLTICAFSSYMFGWHVHEKAILLVVIPLALLSVINYRYARIFILLSSIANVSLFPLFFDSYETPIKYGIAIVYFQITVNSLEEIFALSPIEGSSASTNSVKTGSGNSKIGGRLPAAAFLSKVESAYLLGFVVLELYKTQLHHRIGMDVKFPFLPLMLTSIYCALGVLYSLCLLVWNFLCDELVDAVCMKVMIEKPYAAGFLAFREVEPMVEVVEMYCKKHPEHQPQVLFVDGNGILHPRGFGLACHVGVISGIPTVGVAKNLHLVDEIIKDAQRYEKELVSVGQSIPLENTKGVTMGCALRSSAVSKNPVFVSVGNKLDLPTAVALTMKCSIHRVPEPIRQGE